ncbi:hypothetical protein [Cyprinid herpesvirus 3]|uniref:Uncharacterized protein n=1 Tax=Cyprinid herpesvirus 3 TaxID=180230 RepID=A4FTK1_CYHV3|nr:hypothetical protein [Cyprinid herpesvirus 3]
MTPNVPPSPLASNLIADTCHNHHNHHHRSEHRSPRDDHDRSGHDRRALLLAHRLIQLHRVSAVHHGRSSSRSATRPRRRRLHRRRRRGRNDGGPHRLRRLQGPAPRQDSRVKERRTGEDGRTGSLRRRPGNQGDGQDRPQDQLTAAVSSGSSPAAPSTKPALLLFTCMCSQL